METLRALEPLHRVCQIGNLWSWRLTPLPDTEGTLLRRSRWLELYSWTVLTAASGIAVYGLFQESHFRKNYGSESTISSIGHTVDFIQLMGLRIAHLTALLEALWQKQEQRQFFTELGEIDSYLFKALRVNVQVLRLQVRRQMMRRAVWILWGYIISQIVILGAKLLAPGHSFLMYWICYLLPQLVCGLRYFQISIATEIVRQRLDVVLVILQQLHLQKENPTVVTVPEELADLRQAAMEQLSAVRIVYQRVWALVALLNRCYGLSMLIQVGNDFLTITSNCYLIFLNFRLLTTSPYDILQIVASAMWSAPHLSNVLVLSLLCDRTAQCATRLALCLHQVSVDLRNESQNALVGNSSSLERGPILFPLSPQITQFSLQLLHQRLHFSAAGFFNVDCTLLYTIVGATTTYLIILIQFHMSESTLLSESNGG
ncbi:putative gustatory receptor 2a isoform X1 [Drosophila eugracilis]|uniref:putative gustatory receptor 2a isoform X1 n=1 Tax=Drosophila eugracilis TaxID=29029 RepID=UPI0007E5D5EA|nr:putative gustatory receptor 2a isoform X1 [Drosophila eugracilis]